MKAMTTALTTCGAAVLMAMTTVAGAQQSKSIQGETKTVTVTVEAIEKASREVTVKKSDGSHDVFYVPTTVKRFDSLKVGDAITAHYYETLVLRMKPAGEKDADSRPSSAVVPASGTKAGATAARQQTFTATITAIDPKVPSITFSGPRGWTYSSRVEDTKALAKVKVGDRLDITSTEALVVSIDSPK